VSNTRTNFSFGLGRAADVSAMICSGSSPSGSGTLREFGGQISEI
jgi:hypothetical protein